jgi:hypothetical protein
MDCTVDTLLYGEYYMTTNAVWEEATQNADGYLCLECLENRLSRPLTASDFMPCATNAVSVFKALDGTEEDWEHSALLLARITSGITPAAIQAYEAELAA